jgi:hypothetical protein
LQNSEYYNGPPWNDCEAYHWPLDDDFGPETTSSKAVDHQNCDAQVESGRQENIRHILDHLGRVIGLTASCGSELRGLGGHHRIQAGRERKRRRKGEEREIKLMKY